MQLVDDGLVDLDTPVKKYLPDLKLADRKAQDTVTVRMLLNHTSGIEGDVFRDGGRGDDGIEKYSLNLGDIGQIYRPGEMWSYCNTGWNILGYLVEKVREQTYAQAMKERILQPIGALSTTVLMEEMFPHSCAVGHVLQPGASEPIVPPGVMMSPSHAPAGSMTVSTPAQVLRFVKLHLDLGRARDGARVLSEESAKAMQQPTAKMPFIPQLGTQMGLGWMIDEWDGERVLGHGGNTIGQGSYLKILPDRPFAAILLTNSTTGGLLWRDLARFMFEELAGVHVPDNPRVPAESPKVDLRKYAGKYSRYGLDLDLKVEEGALVASIAQTGELASPDAPAQTARLAVVDREIFLLNLAGQEVVAHFLDFDREGRPGYVHIGARVSKRVASTAKRKPAAKARAKATKAKPKKKR
jgi:CubicO group peptidase (beta-lactamase class C family)